MTSLDQDSDGGQNSSLNYEDDSFESWRSSGGGSRCTAESPATASCSDESQRTDSSCSHSSLSFGGAEFYSQSQSRPTPSVEGYENEDFEQYNEKEPMIVEELREKWIGILRTKVPPSVPPPKQRSNSSLRQEGRPRFAVSAVTSGGRLCPEERRALKVFCQEKIRRVQSLQWTDRLANRAQLSGQAAAWPMTAGPLADCPVPKRLNTEEMKQAAGTELHQTSHCRACQESLAKLAQNTFIRRKKSQLESRLLQDKLQAHLFEKDAICLVGELLRNIPKTSDDPSKIWQELVTNGCWTPPMK
ncbi:hypothetical protein AAFF_G00326360 [Aldrovandia affinis]|uniref:Uncharacterized protein n=1 Tax=Aldrovandia affinis TaxID=143900 RepID=A0AAD7X1J3_9TELE|nr:hypothetical protein AAFF_G00326360 [Aldrovandia affinis]